MESITFNLNLIYKDYNIAIVIPRNLSIEIMIKYKSKQNVTNIYMTNIYHFTNQTKRPVITIKVIKK